MADYKEKLLTILADKYRNSKKDDGSGVIARRTKVTPDQLYRSYYRNDGDLDQIDAVNQAAYSCREKGFVTLEEKSFSNEIAAVYLVDEKIGEVEQYLREQYGYLSKPEKRRYVEHMLNVYDGRSPAAGRECARMRQALEKNKIPPRYLQTEELLKALVFIENNREELFLREASMMIYGDSKYLEEEMLHPVCKALRQVKNRPCGEEEMEDEILQEYHIIRERQKLRLKGNVSVTIGDSQVELGAFSEGVEFFSNDRKRIRKIHIRDGRLMTVENYTSWLRLRPADTTLFYLGGYASREQRDFLKKTAEDNPGLRFVHFGDIDAGGLYIHEHLCRVTGIPFEMYRMSTKELQDPRYRSCLHPLTAQDRIRLESLKQQELYCQLASFMLTQNVKLEQEIVSYYEKQQEVT